MWPRLLFILTLTHLACAGDDGGAASTGSSTTEAPTGACGGEACDPLSHYCMVPVDAVGGEKEAGMCIALPATCSADDPCPCLEPLCEGGTCAESDGGWALLTCNQG